MTADSAARPRDTFDLVCLSHLRWGFVYQRPQHLLSRFARERRVFFVEDAEFHDGPPRLEVRRDAASGVHIVVPRLTHGVDAVGYENGIQALLDELLASHAIHDYVLWYYTPMALGFSRHLTPRATVFDVMDELSAFAFAPPELREREADLFRRADVVFTGGQSLYEAKRDRHHNVHAFPSSVDVAHFAQAREPQPEPADQAAIPHPRVGFAGVIDERLDRDLLAGLAGARPDLHFVMIGPVAKIDPATLPRLPNVHYLGGKGYGELPAYMAGWDAAILPFAHNDSTRFISPTKTPEYLAAGLPVVSTSIRDVVRPYGERGHVRIADTVDEFARAIDLAMQEDAPSATWREGVDTMLRGISWDRTFQGMMGEIRQALEARARAGGTSQAVGME